MTDSMPKAVSRFISTGFGVLMAVVAAAGSSGPVAVVSIASVITVLMAVVFRPAAVLAVLLAMSVIAFGDTTPVVAAVAGLSAAGYLVLRFTATVAAPTLVAAAGFTLVGLVATAFPLQVPWLPLLAPLAAFGCYVLAAGPFLGKHG